VGAEGASVGRDVVACTEALADEGDCADDEAAGVKVVGADTDKASVGVEVVGAATDDEAADVEVLGADTDDRDIAGNTAVGNGAGSTSMGVSVGTTGAG